MDTKNQMPLRNLICRGVVEAPKCAIILCLTLLFLITHEVRADEKTLKKVSFIPQWVPQAQFAGYYVAHELGIYKKHGIDLTIISGGPERQPSDLLKDQDQAIC